MKYVDQKVWLTVQKHFGPDSQVRDPYFERTVRATMTQGLSYECICNPGYQRDPAGCVNIDECRIGETNGFNDCVEYSKGFKVMHSG